jgi:hypothetical protein
VQPPHGVGGHGPPWQFLIRATLVTAGLVLLLVVDVHGLVFYIAWFMIGLALLSEAVATVVYRRRSRGPGR